MLASNCRSLDGMVHAHSPAAINVSFIVEFENDKVPELLPHGKARANLVSRMQKVAVEFLSAGQRKGQNEMLVMRFLKEIPDDASKIVEALVAAGVPVAKREEVICMRDIDKNSHYLRQKMKNRNVSVRVEAFQIGFKAIFRRAKNFASKPFDQSNRRKLLSDVAKYLEMLDNASKNETMQNRLSFVKSFSEGNDIADVIFPKETEQCRVSESGNTRY